MTVKRLIELLQKKCVDIPGTEDCEVVIYTIKYGDMEQCSVTSLHRVKSFYDETTCLQLFAD